MRRLLGVWVELSRLLGVWVELSRLSGVWVELSRLLGVWVELSRVELEWVSGFENVGTLVNYHYSQRHVIHIICASPF